jgi:hypothetical protein
MSGLAVTVVYPPDRTAGSSHPCPAPVRDLGLTAPDDAVVFETTGRRNRTIVSACTDFARIVGPYPDAIFGVVLTPGNRPSSAQAWTRLDDPVAAADALKVGAAVTLMDGWPPRAMPTPSFRSRTDCRGKVSAGLQNARHGWHGYGSRRNVGMAHA